MDKSIREVNTNELEELKRLEIRQKIASILYTHPSLYNCDRTLIRWLSGIMIRAESAEQAIYNWRNLVYRGSRTPNDYTEAQLREINIPDQEIIGLFQQIKEHIYEITPNLEQELVDRITHKYGHYWNDEYEIRQKQKRSLEILLTNGIRISVPKEYIELVRANFIEGAECPILDKVKNMRIVTINGFEGSKMALTIHDIFDHFWFYSRLNRLGILQKYASFLQRVGNPQDTDIFKREGELIASISFDYRGYTVSDPNFKPLFNIDQIKRIITRNPNSTQNQADALLRLETLAPESEEAKGLCYSLSGLTIELMEQRRKHGFIRTLNEDYEIDGNLGILEPEYIALVIESNKVLFDPIEDADRVLLNISVMVEDYLIRLARGQTVDDLIIKIEDLEAFDTNNTAVSSERVKWIQDNIGFAANRRDQC